MKDSPAARPAVVRANLEIPAEEGSPEVAGIVGSPAQVAASLSPAIHNAAFRALELDWVYLAFGMETEWLLRGISGLSACGVRGMNVTLPHKVAVVQAMDSMSESAERIGAVNTIEVRAAGLVGWNTDGEGLVRFLRMDAGASIEGARVLVLGAGGSARAVVFSMASAGAAEITVLARETNRAQALESLVDSADFRTGPLQDVPGAVIKQADIIINATPVGQALEHPAIPAEHIRPGAVVVDLVYRPAITPLIEAARSRGAVAHSGLGMLLHQAALAFEIWTGLPPPMDVMSAAALAGLKRERVPGEAS